MSPTLRCLGKVGDVKYVSKVISKGVTKFAAQYFDHDLHHGNGGTVNLGSFETAKEAAVAYARYAASKGVYAGSGS